MQNQNRREENGEQANVAAGAGILKAEKVESDSLYSPKTVVTATRQSKRRQTKGRYCLGWCTVTMGRDRGYREAGARRGNQNHELKPYKVHYYIHTNLEGNQGMRSSAWKESGARTHGIVYSVVTWTRAAVGSGDRTEMVEWHGT